MIKSKFSFLLGCLITLLMVPAKSGAQVFGGFEGGVNLSRIMGGDEPFPDPDFKFGLNGGTLIGYEFSDKWALEMDLGYIMKGAKQDYILPINDTMETRIKSDIMLSYGQSDLILKFSPPIDRKGVIPYGPFTRRVFLDFIIGGYCGYFLGGEQSTSSSLFVRDSLVEGSKFDSTYTFSSSDSLGINSIDFGIVAGIGVKIKVGKEEKGRIFANFRYALGLNSIDGGIYNTLEQNTDGELVRVKSGLTNHSIIFMVGYAYSFKGGPNRIR